ncbi:hypothetical protein GCM10008171_20860 [Methylopila jiangsuensis]|uniref:Heme degradation protein n=1 Tax=Methylopila jiangsuensis TaxID=586230 RepID=A0A9W6JGK2_9HYPH|nr:hypothetical protein [Methylopila jiangsuensis]MDR6286821.1 putative heme degradation protein [Methylopila jiangsuensis]GLK76832.1 hypothetical protein GCM10008171_20860 [Methylopila jiangsuensis]
MTDDVAKPQRSLLTEGPKAVIARLPLFGRAMLTANHGGATHERIGAIEAVAFEDGAAILSGANHDARIDLGVVVRAVADRTGKMKDRALPRVEFQTANGETAFSVIALDGLAPFEEALAPFADGEPLPEKEKPAPAPAAELQDADPGRAPFDAAHAAGGDVTVALDVPGLSQRWRGAAPEIKPAMGFINVMTADFHLHLRGGAVAGWDREDGSEAVTFAARDGAGAPTGLSVSGPAASFAAS